MFRLGNEFVGIGNLRSIGDILVAGIGLAESDIVLEAGIEEDSLLVYITYQLAEVMHGKVFHIDAVDKHLALLYIVVTRNQVEHRTLSATALSHQCDGLSLRNHQVDILQYINQLIVLVVGIGEGNMAELYLMLEAADMLRVFLVLDFNLSLQNLVDALHACQSLWDIVARLGEFLQRVDDAVEHHEIEDDGRTIDSAVIQNQDTAKPQYHHDEDGSQELTHRMSHLLTDVHAHDVVTVAAIHLVEVPVHLILGAERLDDAQSAQGFLYHAHRVAPERLCLGALCLQLLSNKTHEPTEWWHKEDGEEGELPADADQRNEIEENENRILEEHIERRHDAVLHFLHVTAHSGDDVSLALFAEETKRKRGDLLVELVADIANDTCTDRDNSG